MGLPIQRMLCVLVALSLMAAAAFCAGPESKPYRLPSVSLKQPLIWGATATSPDGYTLTFGGQDQLSEDGIGHTMLSLNGKAVVTIDDLRKGNKLQTAHDQGVVLRDSLKVILARARASYFEDDGGERMGRAAIGLIHKSLENASRDLSGYLDQLKALHQDVRVLTCEPAMVEIAKKFHAIAGDEAAPFSPETLAQLSLMVRQFEEAIEVLDCEPPARALSPIVYHPGLKQFILFGGDHLDYLTNDLWAFDVESRSWIRLDIAEAPGPRANHTLHVNDDGTMTVSGGYQYANNTDYMGGQYLDCKNAEWICDLAKKSWRAGANQKAETTLANSRLYRSGPFSPAYFLEGEKPNRAAFTQFLADLPVNVWTKTNPPKLPKMNRDWGTAVLAPDRDLILRWSGGHCAHGGSDVLEYHMATNRWELPFAVEFPLGQLYDNTEYPEGFNFNRRPWVTGHTYQNYAYDVVSQLMLFTGRKSHVYAYDPSVADWLPTRTEKPKAMIYSGSFYDLTCCATPHGVYCWTHDGALLLSSAKPLGWTQLKLNGEKLQSSSVDNSTLVYDSKRDRLLFFRKSYGDKVKYDGLMQAVDLKTLTVSAISPENAGAASGISYLCQIRYDLANDLLLAGCTLPPDAGGVRRTPAYDPVANRWVSLKITGDDPSGKAGRNVSLGLMYDAGRKCFWAVDTNSQVYVLRLDVKNADVRPLE